MTGRLPCPPRCSAECGWARSAAPRQAARAASLPRRLHTIPEPAEIPAAGGKKTWVKLYLALQHTTTREARHYRRRKGAKEQRERPTSFAPILPTPHLHFLESPVPVFTSVCLIFLFCLI